MPGDWWSRIGPGIAVASGVGYLVGAAALAEFARPLNVTAAELGIETRDYVTIAAVSALTALYLAAFVGAFLGTFLAIVSETGRTSRGQGLLRGPVSFIRDTAAGLTGLFFLAALFIAPTAYLAGSGDTSIYVVLLAGLTITAAFYLALGCRLGGAEKATSAEPRPGCSFRRHNSCELHDTVGASPSNECDRGDGVARLRPVDLSGNHSAPIFQGAS